MLQFQLMGAAAYAYPKSTGVINMIQPDGVQPSPEGFSGGGAVDIPWGLTSMATTMSGPATSGR